MAKSTFSTIGLALALLSGCREIPTDTAPQGRADAPSALSAATALAPNWQEIIVDQGYFDSPWGKAIGDISGDGLPDLLVGDALDPIYWYRAPDWKIFKLSPTGGGDDLAVADMDKDGDLDVISNRPTINWYENPSAQGGDVTQTWKSHMIWSGGSSHDLNIADINRDGKVDVAIRMQSGPSFVFLQGATGDAWTRVDLPQAPEGVGSFLADINKDGRLDMVENGFWLEQPANAVTGTWTRHNFAVWSSNSAVEVADINKDGRPDVFLSAAYDQYQLAWFECPADPTAGNWVQHIVGSNTGYVHRFHLVDMDADGWLDVVFAEQQQSPTKRVGYYRNADGVGGSWGLTVISTAGSHNIVVGDVGADGDLDIFGVNWVNDSRGDTHPRLWVQGGSTPPPSPPPPPSSTSAAAGDARATVTWPSVSGATSYALYYKAGTSVDKQTGTRIANVASPYAVTGLANGTTYAFAVTASSSAGESALGPTATATPAAAPPSPPPPPSSTSAAAGDARATVAWSAVSGATAYALYYKAGSAVDKQTGTRIANVTSPYAVTGLANGTTYAFAVAASSSAGESALGPTATATPAAAPPPPPPPGSQTPYSGTPLLIPGTLQAEGFDLGGEGVAYHDADTANTGGLYRTGGVDIFASSDAGGGGYCVGNTANGEWLEYAATAQQAGPYRLEARLSGTSSNRRFRLEWNGTDFTGPMLAPNTGNNATWQTYTQDVILPAGGDGILRFFALQGGMRLEYVKLTYTGQGMAAAPPAGFQATVEAENATRSGPIVSTQHTGYAGTGFVDYQNDNGDYIEASFTVPVAAVYVMEFRYANAGTLDRPLEILVNGTMANAGLSFPDTGTWTTWSTVSTRVFLQAGANTVRARAMGSSGGNIDWIRVR
jgi:hypothetical protein